MNQNSQAVSAGNVTEGLSPKRAENGRVGLVSLRNRTRDSVLAADVTVADTCFSRLVGLLGEEPSWSSAQRALWIIPSRGVHMLGMRFAIDVVFLDRNRFVVHIRENLRPWQISRVIRSARSVIELPLGTITRTGTQIGDQIDVVPA